LEELGDFFTAQLFEIQTGCGASQIGLELCSEKTPGETSPAFFVARRPRFTAVYLRGFSRLSFALLAIVALITSAFVVNLPLPLGVLGHEESTVIVFLNGLFSLLLPEFRRRRNANVV
jgi:hypothetical protein